MNVDADGDASVQTDMDPGVESAVQQYVEAVEMFSSETVQESTSADVRTDVEQNTDYQVAENAATHTPLETMDPGELDWDARALFSLDEDSALSETDPAAESATDSDLTESDDFDPWEQFSSNENGEKGEAADVLEQSFLSGLQSDTESGIIQRGNAAETTDTAKTAQTQSVAADSSTDPDIEAAVQQYVEAVEMFSSEAAQENSATSVQTDTDYGTLDKSETTQAQQAETGEALLNTGIIPNHAQLDAMGIDEATARGIQSIIWMGLDGDPQAQQAFERMIDLTEGDASLAQESAADTAKTVYTEDDALRNHIENVDPTVARKKGVGGCHRKDLFLENDILIISSTPHPQIHGAEIIEYQMPKRDKTGSPIPGQYQTGDPKAKTVYDPNIISTEEYIRRGLEAANNAAKMCPDGVLPGIWTEFDNSGVKWRGYYRDGKITSFYPE